MFSTQYKIPASVVPSSDIMEKVAIGADFSGVVPASVKDVCEKSVTLEYAREYLNARGETVTFTDEKTIDINGRRDPAFLYNDFLEMEAFYKEMTENVMKDAIKYAKNQLPCVVEYRVTVKYREIVRAASGVRNTENGERIKTAFHVVKTGYASRQFYATPDALEYAYIPMTDYTDEKTGISLLFPVPGPAKNGAYFHLDATETKRRNKSATFAAFLRMVCGETHADDDRREENALFYGGPYEYDVKSDETLTPCKIENTAARVFLDA